MSSTASTRRRRHGQQGFSLLEAIAAIAVLGFVTIMASRFAEQATEDQRAAVTAQHMVTVSTAAQAYIKANFAAVAGVATATTPATITVSALISTGFLPSGFSATNNRGSTVCVHVLEPSAGKLNAMAIATGGVTLDDLALGQVVSLMGAAGGGVYAATAPSTNITGAAGGWSVSASAFSVGCTVAHPAVSLVGRPAYALWFDQNSKEADTLYRDAVPGRPDLNRMTTPILMSSVQTTGAACSEAGAIASSTTGKVVSCQGGTWEEQGGSAYWGDPVNQAAAMPACGAANANETRVRYGYASAPTRRLFTCNGANWVAVGVDHSGNLSVPGNLAVTGTTTFTGEATANGGVTIGNGTAANATNTLVMARTATEGAACSPGGAVARDAAGSLLSCRSGEWRRPANWATAPQTVGANCNAYGAGTLAYETATNDLLYCK